jgi:hypothetical protein
MEEVLEEQEPMVEVVWEGVEGGRGCLRRRFEGDEKEL